MGKHIINHEGKSIHYTLFRKSVKNINLRVRADSSVSVSANKAVPFGFIEQVLKQNASWIIRKIERLEERRNKAVASDYSDGEIIFFLGCPYRLRLVPTAGRGKADLVEGEILLFADKNSRHEEKERLINAWYRKQAEVIFQEALDRMHSLVAGCGIAKPALTIRFMKTRWGSCSGTRPRITLNTALIKVSPAVIDYVILHELAHFRYRRHDSSFYVFLTALMPDWRERKAMLKSSELEISGRGR